MILGSLLAFKNSPSIANILVPKWCLDINMPNFLRVEILGLVICGETFTEDFKFMAKVIDVGNFICC